MDNALQLYTPQQFAILEDLHETANALSENLRDGLNPVYFTRVKFPAAGGTTWEIEAAEGLESVRELTGIIIYKHTSRRLYLSQETSNQPPVCSSGDGWTGQGNPGGDCQSCPCNQWGSGPGGFGKKCQERRTLYVLRQSDVLPLVLDLPSMSITPFEKYMTQLASRKTPYWQAVTTITLSREQTDRGKAYSKTAFKMEGKITPEAIPALQEYNRKIGSSLSAATQPPAARNPEPPPQAPRPTAQTPPPPMDRNFKFQPPPPPPIPETPVNPVAAQPRFDSSLHKADCKTLQVTLKNWGDTPPNIFQGLENWNEEKWTEAVEFLRNRAEKCVARFYQNAVNEMGEESASGRFGLQMKGLGKLSIANLISFGNDIRDAVEIPF